MKPLVVFGTFTDTSPNVYIFDREFDATIVSFYQPTLTGNINAKKVVVFGEKYVSVLLWPWKFLIRTLRLWGLAKQHDVVVGQFDQANISLLPLLFLKKLFRPRLQVVAFLRAGREEYEINSASMRFIRFCVRYFYRYFDQVITVSDGNKRMLERDFGLGNIAVSYNAISVDYAKQQATPIDVASFTTIKNPFVFVAIGRLKEQKCFWGLLRVFRKVVDACPHAVLLILGDGPMREHLQGMIDEMKLEENVTLVGYQQNVFSFLSAADCFVMTPLWESFGVVIVEAIALGIPVVYADNAGPREILAPELKSTPKYPYFGQYGVLLPVFERRIFFDSVEQKPLDSKEDMVADCLISLVQQPSQLDSYRVDNRSKDFELAAIARRYRQLLSNDHTID